jgi:SNF2 family DNA or RNA helicase
MNKLRPLWTGFSYFQHQLDGINWMLDKEINGTLVPNRNGSSEVLVRGGFQCDDMGLGKTIQVTSCIVNNIKPLSLLLAPLAMIQTWVDVLIKAGCAVYTIDTKTAEWVLQNPDSPVPRHFIKQRPSVYISNYEKLYSKSSLFNKSWNRIVLDEAHKIRNGDGQIARSARKLTADIRWVVTGTPLVNSLKDIVSLLAFLGVPHSPLFRWEPRYLRILPDLLLHRSLDSLRSTIKGAPPVPVIHNEVLPFVTSDEEEFYFGVQGATESLGKKYSSELLSSSEAFKLLIRLRQISVHPQVYINAKRRESTSYDREDWLESSTKLDKITQIISDDDDSHRNHKYLIFCQFNDEMALIRQHLLNQCLIDDENILMYNGSMNQTERNKVLARSKEVDEKMVLLIQLQAGGVGLNLQEYDRIIFVSPWWTSALMDQAIARAVRIGQTSIVHVYHLHLSAEKDNSVNIDVLVGHKADEKRKMLLKLFHYCEENRL